MKKARRKLATLALSLFALASFVVPAVTVESVFADTQTAIEHLSMTDIEDDLQDLDKTAYPYDKNGKTKVVRFQEYCYTQQAGAKDMYGIYLYVYNPTQKKVRATSNVVNMAVEYDSEGNPMRYENVALTLLDKTEDNRFIKFKVTDSASLLKKVNVYALKHNGERRYDISDVNLYFLDGSGSEAANVSKSYVWTGYAVGMNNNAESTLSCAMEDLQTLTLNVKHTYFRDATGDYIKSTDTVHSVYFSVPNQVLDEYGALYQVHAEYLSARLKPALVLGDEDIYNEVAKYLWYDMSSYKDSLDYQIFGGLNQITLGPVGFTSEYAFNYREKSDYWFDDRFADWILNSFTTISTFRKVSPLYMLFSPDNFGLNSADGFTLSSERLKQAMLNTSKNPFSTGSIVGADGEYSKDIFSHVDDKKTDIVLTANDTFDLTKTVYEKNWWLDRFGAHGWGNSHETIFSNRPVIHQVQETDFLYDDKLNAHNLLVAYEDFADFKQAYSTSKQNNETLFLFHYRITNYESQEVAIFKQRNRDDEFELVSTNGYFFEEDVDLQFDIIDVMFKDEMGVETVMGVVSKPTDYVPGATPPPNTITDKLTFWEWLKQNYVWVILAVVGYLLLCCLGKALYPTCLFIIAAFPAIWWIITIPFRFIIWLIRSIKERRS